MVKTFSFSDDWFMRRPPEHRINFHLGQLQPTDAEELSWAITASVSTEPAAATGAFTNRRSTYAGAR
jgi:hypothetical protein